MTNVVQLGLKTNDTVLVEQILPAHMMTLMLEQCGSVGVEARADLIHKLNNAAAAPLASLDMFSVSRIAKKTDDAARALLHELSPDDPREGLYVSAMLAIVLLDEGLITDPQNMAVLVGLLLMEDVKDDSRDVNGQSAIWKERERQWQKDAKNLIRRAKLLGYYLPKSCN